MFTVTLTGASLQACGRSLNWTCDETTSLKMPGVRGSREVLCSTLPSGATSPREPTPPGVHHSSQSNSQHHSLPGLQGKSQFQRSEIELNGWRRVALSRRRLHFKRLNREATAVGDGDAEESLLAGVEGEWRGQSFHTVPNLKLAGGRYL